jgi:LacI family transcriptional regulator
MANRRYPSVKDVARAAGVSFQTASKVLNGGSVRVSRSTACRIRDAAADLGYSPNTIARSLVRQATGTIGLIATDQSDPAISHFVVAAERAARRRGYAVLIGHLDAEASDGAEVVRMLAERRVDGIIAAAPQVENDPDFADLLRAHGPAVSLHHVPGGGLPVVGSQHRDTGRLAAEHLLALGHTIIGTITGSLSRRVVRARLHGYEDALRAAGLEPQDDLLVEGGWSEARGAAAARLLLRRRPRVTAIFVHSDAMAVGVLSEIAAAGASVPADIAVVGCDDLPFAEFLVPALTTVRVPLAQTGEQAVELLLAAIAGQPDPPGPVILPVELIVRASTGAATAAAGLTPVREAG